MPCHNWSSNYSVLLSLCELVYFDLWEHEDIYWIFGLFWSLVRAFTSGPVTRCDKALGSFLSYLLFFFYSFLRFVHIFSLFPTIFVRFGRLFPPRGSHLSGHYVHKMWPAETRFTKLHNSARSVISRYFADRIWIAFGFQICPKWSEWRSFRGPPIQSFLDHVLSNWAWWQWCAALVSVRSNSYLTPNAFITFRSHVVFVKQVYQAKRKNIFGPLKAKWIGRSDRICDPENGSGSECRIRSNFLTGSGIRSKKIGSVRSLQLDFYPMGGLADCAISARRRTTAHFTVVSTVLCTDYEVNKTVSCVLMNLILVTMI
jgi:hypothetical protein